MHQTTGLPVVLQINGPRGFFDWTVDHPVSTLNTLAAVLSQHLRGEHMSRRESASCRAAQLLGRFSQLSHADSDFAEAGWGQENCFM